MNEINEQIKQIHELFKKRGDWDGLPGKYKGFATHPGEVNKYDDGPVTMYDCIENTESRNAYIAGKLDLITEAIVDAMRVRREGKRVEHNYGFIGIDTEESNLALAHIRTMDLMGFYGVEYDCPISEDRPITWDVANTFRICVAFTVDCSVASDNGADHQDLPAILNAILHIAELDKIDLQWHVDARLKYMESEVK